MNNKKGQSLVEVIFSITVVVLVLTGIVALAVSTSKARRMTFERQKATEMAQELIENKVNEVKKDPEIFWNSTKYDHNGVLTNEKFPGYTYSIRYSGCDTSKCTVIFTVNWNVGQSLSVQRFFSSKGL